MNENMDDNLVFNDMEPGGAKFAESIPEIKVVGVGGAGCNAVNYMFHRKISNVSFAALNTDQRHLELKIDVPCKLVLGYEITKGGGAGNKPEVGRECAEASTEEIKELFSDGTQMAFITAGMGGGTGTGAAPVVARIAKESGILTIGIVTIPFLFEGEKKILRAVEGAEEMKKYVDALLIINNQNLVKIYSDLSLKNAFAKSDDTLDNAARSVAEIISNEGYINVDFRDVHTTLINSGTAIISTAYGEGENRISDAIHNALYSPLLKEHDIYSAKRILIKLIHNEQAENPVRIEEMNEFTQFTAKLPRTIDVKYGIAEDPELGNKVKITILASGFDVTLREQQDGGVIQMNPEAHIETKPKQNPNDVYTSIYGVNKQKMLAQAKYVVLKPSQFDDDEVIAKVERTPAYNRDSKFNDSLKTSTAVKESTTNNNDSGSAAGQTNAIIF
jgi:cell division protein FtsZ